jgi:hypothetical protein
MCWKAEQLLYHHFKIVAHLSEDWAITLTRRSVNPTYAPRSRCQMVHEQDKNIYMAMLLSGHIVFFINKDVKWMFTSLLSLGTALWLNAHLHLERWKCYIYGLWFTTKYQLHIMYMYFVSNYMTHCVHANVSIFSPICLTRIYVYDLSKPENINISYFPFSRILDIRWLVVSTLCFKRASRIQQVYGR